MRRMHGLAVVMMVVALSAACFERHEVLSGDDSVRKQQLESEFGQRYTFAAEDVYLRAHARKGVPSRDDAIAMVKLFWLDDQNARSNSNLTYLNLYDSQGKFAFQAYWDPQTKTVAFSKAEHY